MIRFVVAVLMAALLVDQAIAQSALSARIAAAIADTPATARANWGVQVVKLNEEATVLYRRNADRYFTPASNTKLYSTALALLRLGPDYRFETVVGTAASIDNGRIAGDLVLVGGGDPSMSWRAYPFVKGPSTVQRPPLTAIEELAAAIVDRGIRRIDGGIVGDDTRWPHSPYPEGWAFDDGVWEYGSPTSALTINDNAIKLTVEPGPEAGSLARLTLLPALEYYWIDNRVVTQEGGRLEVARMPGSRQLRLTGRISPRSSGRVELLAIEDPAHYAAFALHDALTRRGVSIGEAPSARHRAEDHPYVDPLPTTVLARRQSPPLSEILQVVNKVSQNLHAEMILRETAFRIRREGTASAGVEELRLLLASIGVEKDAVDFRDGSGMSRLALTTPETTIRLLRHMWNSPHRDLWAATLPVGGEDGTLENRFQVKRRPGQPRYPDASAVRAKTGTLTHVTALSGYIRSKTHGPVAFSIMVNNTTARSSEIRAAVDRIALEIAR
jgi:D-alanyl-D-alanine carboxypeptidase/D-alanyl-D-alanine-endopeptidase (penicillin-binding protein 4)